MIQWKAFELEVLLFANFVSPLILALEFLPEHVVAFSFRRALRDRTLGVRWVIWIPETRTVSLVEGHLTAAAGRLDYTWNISRLVSKHPWVFQQNYYHLQKKLTYYRFLVDSVFFNFHIFFFNSIPFGRMIGVERREAFPSSLSPAILIHNSARG